ncbi:MAG: hypothetical protein AB1405_12915 [Bdellovibrionota bacterium]
MDLSNSINPRAATPAPLPELAAMPAHYNARVPADLARRHAELIRQHPGEGTKDFLRVPASCAVATGPFHHQLSVFCPDALSAFVNVTAAVALGGGSIYEANLYSRLDGTLLCDIAFILSDREAAKRVGGIVVEIFGRGRKAEVPGCGIPKGLDLSVLPPTGGEGPALLLKASDTPGLLFRAARALFRSGIKVIRADIHTGGGRVRDIFVVAGRDGKAPDLESILPRLYHEMTAVLR